MWRSVQLILSVRRKRIPAQLWNYCVYDISSSAQPMNLEQQFLTHLQQRPTIEIRKASSKHSLTSASDQIFAITFRRPLWVQAAFTVCLKPILMKKMYPPIRHSPFEWCSIRASSQWYGIYFNKGDESYRWLKILKFVSHVS